MRRDQVEVEQRNQLPASVAAAKLHDDVDLGIAEGEVEVLDARLRSPSEIAALLPEVLALHYPRPAASITASAARASAASKTGEADDTTATVGDGPGATGRITADSVGRQMGVFTHRRPRGAAQCWVPPSQKGRQYGIATP